MRIVINEIKKIWSIKMLLIVALLCAIFYLISMTFVIGYLYSAHPGAEEIKLATELTRRYGATLEDDELADFAEIRDALITEAESYIKGNPVFENRGVYTYADYEYLREKQFGEASEAESSAYWLLLSKECDFVQFKLETLERYEDGFTPYIASLEAGVTYEKTSERERARLTEIRDTEEYRNIMSRAVFENTVSYITSLAVLLILAALVLVSPIIVTDRMRKLHLLQYSAKQGRKLLAKQLAAVLISAFLLTTALLVVFGVIYSTNGTFAFWNNGLNSFLNPYNIIMLNMSYGQYITALVVMAYLLTLGTSAFAFVFSRFSQNLIALLMKLIPIFIAVVLFCSNYVFDAPFARYNILYRRTGVVGIEAVVCAVILIAGFASSFIAARRERRIDVN
jgi:hypothetical protein